MASLYLLLLAIVCTEIEGRLREVPTSFHDDGQDFYLLYNCFRHMEKDTIGYSQPEMEKVFKIGQCKKFFIQNRVESKSKNTLRITYSI